MWFLKSVLSIHGMRNIATAAIVVWLAILTPMHQATAAQRVPYVVGSDRGGYLRDRLIELSNLQRSGAQVQIRGRVCYSTCTMFLGLSGTCVDPKTTFGFHGPSKSGRELEPQQFEYFSKVMADYYPPQLRSWFMRKARYRISGVYKIKGTELIRMGIQACGSA